MSAHDPSTCNLSFLIHENVDEHKSLKSHRPRQGGHAGRFTVGGPLQQFIGIEPGFLSVSIHQQRAIGWARTAGVQFVCVRGNSWRSHQQSENGNRKKYSHAVTDTVRSVVVPGPRLSCGVRAAYSLAETQSFPGLANAARPGAPQFHTLFLRCNPQSLHLPIQMASFQPKHFSGARHVPVILVKLFEDVIAFVSIARLMQS